LSGNVRITGQAPRGEPATRFLTSQYAGDLVGSADIRSAVHRLTLEPKDKAALSQGVTPASFYR